jgi:hypothetical protein
MTRLAAARLAAFSFRAASVILAAIAIIAWATAVTGTVAAFIIALTIVAAPAHDTGQIPPDVPDHIRSWFKSVKSPNGIPCCDIADGHRTTWRGTKDGDYEVPIDDEWVPVPPEAVIYNAGNPVGEAVVWYVRYADGSYYIRCFVPGGGV